MKVADRESAHLFSMIFEILAEYPDERNKALALRFWGLTGGYDFAYQQMECDDALVTLGLAKKISNRKCPEKEIVAYMSSTGLEAEEIV